MRWVCLLLLLAAGALGWWLVRSEGGETPREPEAPPAREAASVTVPVLVGSAAVGRPEGADDEVLVAALPPGLPAWGFFGTLRRSPTVPAPGAVIRVALEGPEGPLYEARATAAEDGTYRLGPLALPAIPRRVRRHVQLAIRTSVDGVGGGLTIFGLAHLADRIRGASGDPRWLKKDGTVSDLRLRPGRVLTSRGHPVEGLRVRVGNRSPNQATELNGVFAYASRSGVASSMVDVEITGGFRLAFREVMDLPPGDEMLEVRLPGDRDTGGRVVDIAGRPVAGIHLVLSMPGWRPDGEVRLLPGGFTSPDARVRLSTRSAEDGTFSFPGLIAGASYELWWPGGDARWVKHDREVRAHASDLRVVLERHAFEVRLAEAATGKIVYGATHVGRLDLDELELYRRAIRMGEAEPNEQGTIGTPGERFRIEAWAPGYAFASETWTMPEAPGRHVVDLSLQALDPPPVVRVRCVDETGSALGLVPLRFVRPGVDGGRAFKIYPTAVHEQGVQVFETLPPGPVAWEIPEKLGRPPNGKRRYLLPAKGTFEVPAEGEVTHTLTCPQGGSVRLHFPTPDIEGRSQSRTIGNLYLEDEAGTRDSPWWFEPQADGGWRFEMISYGRHVPDGRTFECSAKAPGPYALVIEESDAWEELRVPLRIDPCRVTDVHLDLRPKPRGR